MVAERAGGGRGRGALSAAAILVSAWSCSCGRAEDAAARVEPGAREAPPSPGASGQRRSRGAAPAELIGEEPYGSAELGALFGEIRFEGQAPARFALGAVDKAECKHHADVDQRSNVVIVNDGKLQNAYVYLKSGVDPARIPPVPAVPVALDQRGCMYLPRVLALRAGQKLLVRNGDPTNHNVHLEPRLNNVPSKNVNMGKGQDPLEFVFARREHGIPFQCDIHPWMGAVVHVEEHPWFAVSDERGRFRIEGIPPGEYAVEADHEVLEPARGSVRVEAGRAKGIALVLRSKE